MRRYDAVLFDLLTGLLDSWSLWNDVAADPALGRRWRMEYLRRTYGEGAYRDYESLVAEAAAAEGLPPGWPAELAARVPELRPWPGARAVLLAVRSRVPIGVLTNCSVRLGEQAVACIGVEFDRVVIAERSGWYKPHPKAYAAGLAAMRTEPARTLFVAGSPFDVDGASAAGMPVYWHNRAGLPAPEGGARPVRTERSLEPLPDLLG